MSAARRVWFDRKFELGLPPEAFSDIRERLRGTPLRVRERVSACAPDGLTARAGDRWSVLENVGHLLDLERLWTARFDELLAGAAHLMPADLENRLTHEANHNLRNPSELVAELGATRSVWVARLDALDASTLGRTALHPRLNHPMSITDLVFFVAEHDDHHLAQITEIIVEQTKA